MRRYNQFKSLVYPVQKMMSLEILRRKFTVREYHLMAEAGVFADGDRVELVNGEIINMSPVGTRHAACVKQLNRRLSRIPEERAIVGIQDPIQLSDGSEPQPDVVLLKFREDYYETAHPTPSDILLLIEVSDSTIEYDRTVKLPLYAKAGIREVWIVDLMEDCIEIYRQPTADGYEFVQTALGGQTISTLAFPEFEIDVNGVFPKSDRA